VYDAHDYTCDIVSKRIPQEREKLASRPNDPSPRSVLHCSQSEGK